MREQEAVREAMPTIERSDDCGNSPKNKLVEDLAVALLTRDTKVVSDLVTNDVEWSVAGGKTITGREAVLGSLDTVNEPVIEELVVFHAVTHGKAGAVNGKVRARSGSADFCHVFEFSSAKGTAVKGITSFLIKK